MNVPLGILAITSAMLFLHLTKGPRNRAPPDVAGLALLAIASTGLVLTTTWGVTTWNSVTIMGLIVITVVAVVTFVFVERKAVEPIMPPHLFKDRNFNLTIVDGLLTGIAMFSALGHLPTYLQMATGANATKAGFLMIP